MDIERFLSADPDVVRKISENGGYDYIIVGSGFGGGVLADELAGRGKRVLLIERGHVTFTTHVCNTARPSFVRGKDDSPEGNETIYNTLKGWVQLADGSEPYIGGPLYCLGGRSVVWGLWIPPASANTLNDHFPPQVAQDLTEGDYFTRAFDLVTNGSQDPDAPYPEGQVDEAYINTAKTQVTQAVQSYDASPVVLGPTATQFQTEVYRFPQGAYSTVERLLNRVYARDPSLTILMNAEVLEVEHVSTDGGPRSVPALSVRLTDNDTNMKISTNGAQVILAAGTLCTAQIALNSSLQLYNPLVGKGLTDHAIYATRFAMERPSGEPSAPLLLQTMIHINDTTALLTVTINNNFFLAGSSNVPIRQYLSTKLARSGKPHLIEMKNGEAEFKDHAERFDTLAVLIEYGAPLEDTNLVVNAGAPHPVIRLRREHTYHDEDSLINMQILTTRIRNAVAKDIVLKKMGSEEIDVSLAPVVDALSTVRLDGQGVSSGGGTGTTRSNAGDDLDELGELMKAIAAELAPVPELLGCGIFAHETGTMRMGTTADNSVVDQNLKVHNFSNLHVCDMSVFPYSVEANPAITLAALTLRLADHLVPSTN